MHHLKNLFSPAKQGLGVYKAQDETTVSLDDKEKEIVLREALQKKIAKINSENYLKVLSYKPTYTIPKYDDLLAALYNHLRENFNWIFDQYNIPVIEKLAAYFSNDKRFEKLGHGYSLDKGLLLFGDVGCGKTTLLTELQQNPFRPYRMVSARDMASQYAEHGQKAVDYYSVLQPASKNDNYGHEFIGLCIDDMGTEDNKKNFGNELNVISEVILNRYDKKVGNAATHTTTNLSGESIIKLYGEREASRLRQMVNFIEFPIGSPDRRK